jgi:hypothetical protein
MRRICLILLAVLIIGCGAESTPTIAPPPTRDIAATVVASIKITLTAEAARMPTATPTDTPAPTATATPTPLPPPRLEGQVLDARSDEPLAGAQVAANERETATDSDGRFLFADLAPGQYPVLITSADHDPVLSGIVDLRAPRLCSADCWPYVSSGGAFSARMALRHARRAIPLQAEGWRASKGQKLVDLRDLLLLD